MNKCFKCGTEFEGSFCPNCGAKYEESKSCPQCGVTLHGSARFCNHCGHSFVESSANAKQLKQNTVGKTIKNAVQKSKAWIIAHKTLAIIVAAVILAGILLAVVLPLTVGNVFRANRIAKINIGDDYAKVEKVLGKPYEDKSSEYEYNYYGDNVLKKLKELEKLNAQMDKIEDFDDLEKFADKEEKLKSEIEALEYKQISISFSDGKVTKVQYDTHAKQNHETAIKWSKNGGGKQKIVFVPNEIIYGLTPQDSELYAKIYYADGSYRLSRVYPKKIEGDKSEGWTISWSDDWGEYTSVIRSSTTVTKDSIIKGFEGEFTYTLTPIFDGKTFTGFSMEIKGEGEIPDQESYSWTEVMSQVTELIIGEGITNVPSYATKVSNRYNYTTSRYENAVLEKVVLPDSVTVIGEHAFAGCVKLTSIRFPDSVTAIGEYAFEDCVNLTDVTIPENVTTICESAFYNCNALTTITIPENVIYVGAHVFWGCDNLTTVYLNAIDCTMESTDGIFPFNMTKVVIGENVQKIPSCAFVNCYQLTSIEIPENVTAIGDNAFLWTGLINVTLPSNLASIGRSAFGGCHNLTTVYWNAENCTATGANFSKGIFDNCENLTNIVIGANVQTISRFVFSNCSALTNITIPANVTSIEYSAFSGSALQTVTFAENSQLESIAGFNDCSNLTSITIPESVTTIGESAFSSCIKLSNITIPKGVTNIGCYAFSGCNMLTSVIFENCDGWWYAYSNSATSGTSIDSTELSNSKTAAQYLTDEYRRYYWHRSED